MYTLKIEHCSDRIFLDRFRADLANATGEVVILSPFLSTNRAVHYYPILSILTARSVTVDVYARPQYQQPESIREHYSQVETGLNSVGASLHTRVGMHEKIGILDKRILWHGSLNILSHNDTRESMLRFESPDLIAELLTELELKPTSARKTDSTAVSAVGVAVPACPICAEKMLPFVDAGMWLCVRSPECSGNLQLTPALTKQENQLTEVKIACPVCGETLNVSRGIFLRAACSSRECGFSLDPRIASSLLRVLRKKGVA
jgi:hypothetical protein